LSPKYLLAWSSVPGAGIDVDDGEKELSSMSTGIFVVNELSGMTGR
jgi:hypothetical protein